MKCTLFNRYFPPNTFKYVFSKSSHILRKVMFYISMFSKLRKFVDVIGYIIMAIMKYAFEKS